MGLRILPRARAVAALVLVTAIVPASFPVQAWAQAKAGTPSKKDLEAAKKAFFEGIDFEEKKQWDKALEQFELVAKVRMTPQVRFHIALCKENLGMLIEALHDFEMAESDAKAEKVEAVMKEAPEHAAAIKPKIPKLVFKVPSDVEGLAVTLDGNPIDPKGGEETLVNPGTHKIEATAEKRRPFSQEITLQVGDTKTVNIKVPPMQEEEPPPPKEEEPQPTPKPSSLPIPALVVGGIGVAALAGAGIFALKRSSIKSELDEACTGDPPSCPPDKEDAISSGRTYTTLTNVFMIVGIVGVGAGVVLWVTAPKKEEPKAAPAAATIKLVPSAPGANLAGLSLSGAF